MWAVEIATAFRECLPLRKKKLILLLLCCCSLVDLFLTILFLSPCFILDISLFVYRCVCVKIGCFTCRNVKFPISINNCLLNKLFYWMISLRFDVVWLKGFISFTALYSILRKIKKEREREKEELNDCIIR